jgi:ribosomal-protein-alanine N-acetyltransferase
MQLDCGCCNVRSWRSSDLDALVRHADNPRVAQNLRDLFPSPYTKADGAKWLALMAQQRPETGFAIEVAGAAVGGIGVTVEQDIQRVSAEIGYWLGESFWGRGVATAALIGFSRYVFANFDVTRLFALAFVENAASMRVLEKSGYRLEGILRRSAIKNGQILDQAQYALIRSSPLDFDSAS